MPWADNPLKAFFVHQNCPGQFKHLAPAMAARGDEVIFVSQKGRPDVAGVRKLEYTPHRKVNPNIHPYLASSEAAVLNVQAVARIGFALAVVNNVGSGFSVCVAANSRTGLRLLFLLITHMVADTRSRLNVRRCVIPVLGSRLRGSIQVLVVLKKN